MDRILVGNVSVLVVQICSASHLPLMRKVGLRISSWIVGSVVFCRVSLHVFELMEMAICFILVLNKAKGIFAVLVLNRVILFVFFPFWACC